MEGKADHFLLICSRCQNDDATRSMRTALKRALPDGFAIRAVPCMAGCDRPATVGFQGRGKAQYLFGDITTQGDIDALITFARQYQSSNDGWTNATDRPAALFDKTLSRLPALDREVPG